MGEYSLLTHLAGMDKKSCSFRAQFYNQGAQGNFVTFFFYYYFLFLIGHEWCFTYGTGVKDGVAGSTGFTCRSKYLQAQSLESYLLPHGLARVHEVLLVFSESERQLGMSVKTWLLCSQGFGVPSRKPLENFCISWKAALYSAKKIFTLMTANCPSMVSELSLQQYVSHYQC